MNNDVFVFRRGMDEGKIGTLKFMDAAHRERCTIHLYVTFRLDIWSAFIDLSLLQDLRLCVFVFVFSGLGQDTTDYIDVATIWSVLHDILFKAFAQAGFAKKGQDENKVLPCPTGTFVNSSASDPSKLVCLECPAGRNILTIR